MTDTVDILVEIRVERPLSIGIIPGELNAFDRAAHLVIWIPRAEIIATKPEANGRATLTLPRWLADLERLTPQTTEDPNQWSMF